MRVPRNHMNGKQVSRKAGTLLLLRPRRRGVSTPPSAVQACHNRGPLEKTTCEIRQTLDFE